jgi:Cdc6-like AAA superfamily ATPase
MRPVSEVCRYPILIHGPPGTGKTHTLSSMILSIALLKPKQLIHVVAPSNAAMRQVAVRLLRDIERTGILHASQLALYGHEDNIDVADGIEGIYHNMRVERLKDIRERLFSFKKDTQYFHSTISKEAGSELPVALTWKWRKETIEEGCRIMFALGRDLGPAFVKGYPEVDRALSSMQQWLSRTKPSSTSLVDLNKNLFELAATSIASISLNSFDDQSLAKHAVVCFSTVNAAGNAGMRQSASRRPLVLLDEGKLFVSSLCWIMY